MKMSLKELKATKGQVKEFAFLTKITDYVTKEYGEIIDMLDSGNITEILKEISQNGKVPFAVYDSASNIVVQNKIPSIYTHDKGKVKEEELKANSLSAFYASLGDIINPLSWEANKHIWGGYREIDNLSDVYYVSDIEGFKAYIEELHAEEAKKETARLVKRQQEETERLEKRHAEKKAEREMVALVKEKYGVTSEEDIKLACTLEDMASEDPKKRLEAARNFSSTKISTSEMYDIAYEVANEKVSDHYYDEH